MKILVTGNQGYIGAVLTEVLQSEGHEVVGYDAGYYRDCALAPLPQLNRQIEKDIRAAVAADFAGVDGVIHLAALSNDPLGELDPSLTDQINFQAALTVAQAAKAAGVKRFVYGSSQSMYGIANTDEELDEDQSEKHPLTAYARTKWQAECELWQLADDDFIVVAFRPSTVFGASPLLRCDIVFNNLVACAFTTGKIEIKSDGTPWRPVVHVRDTVNAYLAGLEAPAELVNRQAFNVGIANGNYTVRDLAEAAQRAVPGSELVFTGEHGKDTRTYRVSFKKILTVLKDYYRPAWDLDRGGAELISFFKQIGFTEAQFRGRSCNRLQQIKHLREIGQLDENLRWLK